MQLNFGRSLTSIDQSSGSTSKRLGPHEFYKGNANQSRGHWLRKSIHQKFKSVLFNLKFLLLASLTGALEALVSIFHFINNE
jgi:hypothetical protein